MTVLAKCYLCLRSDMATENPTPGGVKLCSLCQRELQEDRKRLAKSMEGGK